MWLQVRLKLDNELLQNWVERVRAEFDEVRTAYTAACNLFSS